MYIIQHDSHDFQGKKSDFCLSSNNLLHAINYVFANILTAQMFSYNLTVICS